MASGAPPVRMQGEPGLTAGVKFSLDFVSGCPASLETRGSSNNQSWFRASGIEYMAGGTIIPSND